MRVRTFLGLGGVAVGAVAASAVALGGTPDDVEPSREDVCDGLTGAAYGVCTAYCEAMDCDFEKPNASPTACRSTARKFAALTGGQKPPCELQPPPACTVDAQDDGLDLNDPAPWTLAVLANDVATPAGTTLTITANTAPADITLDSATSGVFSGAWTDSHEAYVRTFTYTACCDATTCDTATVTILGS